MKIWYHNVLDSQREVAEITGDRVRVGSDPDCDIVLRSPYVDQQAITFELEGDQRRVRVTGRNGCEIDSERLSTGATRSLTPTNRVRLFPFLLTLDAPVEETVTEAKSIDEFGERMSALIRAVHVDLLDVMELDGDDEQRRENDAYLLQMERSIDELCVANGLSVQADPHLVDHIAGEAIRAMIVGELIESTGTAAASDLFDDARCWSRIISASPECEAEAEDLAHRLRDRLGLDDGADLSQTMATLDSRFGACFQSVLAELLPDFRLYLAKREVKKQIKDIVFGYGPLEDLLRIPTVTEIMVVNKDRIYVEKHGKVEQSGRRFISDAVTLTIANRIMSRVGRSVDRARPLVDARLLDGSRVNAVIPPIAVSGPCLTIRKFPAHRLTMERLVSETGSLTKEAAEFLRAAVLAKKNILISGGTGTGKTTLLNCLSDCLGKKERIVTVEDTAELQLAHEHVVRLETKHKNAEGGGEYTIRDLVRNALRMRPDRIVVGECRGGEALDMLQAMNTGHDGSLTTLHANTPEDVVRRLEVLVQSSDVALGAESIHSQISSAIDLVVQLHRTPEGPRVVSHVTEVLPQRRGQKGVETRDLFVRKGEAHRLAPTGRLPTFIDSLIAEGGMELELMYP